MSLKGFRQMPKPAVVYMFYALAIVCDVYFVPSLEKISENFQLSEDVAGATFMAAGSSAPELFTSLIGVFITKGDLGVGTIVGSAVFNILVICGIFAVQPIFLSWWPLLRYTLYYILSILMLIVVIYDDKVIWWETIILISMYLVSIIIMKFNRSLSGWVENRQRLIHARGQEHDGATWGIESGGAGDSERQSLEGDGDRDGGPEGNTGGLQPKEEEEEELEEEEVVAFSPFIVPGGHYECVRWLVSWQLCLLLCCTIPNCVLPRWSRWYLLTFLASTLWVALFSYLMVWMVTIISFTLGIPEVVMGITLLAAGTSVPDCMASLIVARQGMGDMAVSISIGNNIFDVLLGFGFPWFLRTLVVDYRSEVFINSKGLVCLVILLLGSVFLTVLSVHLNRWWMDRRLGLCLMMLYHRCLHLVAVPSAHLDHHSNVGSLVDI
ncbi:sodium/potassium/calcium exchanger 3-like [Oncorhynchus kisutch]|uniref:sodium/potassium/calcium exchanger 3-like n=1 Tax=Oncorhynchus kisutch TaxID=8019 RepID=UPI0012DD6DB1|nr:sodium/potassium/calcium exchanger 3-like [Oncorhynchus kisutch]